MRRLSFLALTITGVLVAAAPALAGEVGFGGLTVDSGISVPTQSFQARKFSTTIEQQYDFSCGSAALATLLRFSYDKKVSEQNVFSDMFLHGDKRLIKSAGFSLLDMKNYLARHGFDSAGFRAPLAKLAEVSLPAIVLINESGYNHFVVIRGFRDGEILIADPAVGMKLESIKHFQAQWSGIFFLILSDAAAAQQKFRADMSWKYAPLPPYAISEYAVTLATLQQVTIRNSGSF